MSRGESGSTTQAGWDLKSSTEVEPRPPNGGEASEPLPLPELPRRESSELRVSSLLLENISGFIPRVAQTPQLPAAFGPAVAPTVELQDMGLDETPVRVPAFGDDFDRKQTGLWDVEEPQQTAPDTDDALLVGGRYRIVDYLGVGGMSSVRLVEHLQLGKEFALKIIAKQHASDARIRKFFAREAKVLSRLEHPNIVQVIDYGLDDHHGAYVVMERLEGESLYQRIRRDGGLKRHQAIDYALQIAEALHYVHSQSLVHYDVKSENVLLCPLPVSQRGHKLVKLIDFGLSRTEALGAQLAQSEVAGTPLYMAPEQINGEAPRPSMDIYSFGVVLYEMLTGRHPFQGTIREVMRAHWEQEPPPPSTFMDEPMEDLLEQLVLRALAKKPQRRQSSMGQIIYELRTVADMAGMSRRRGSPLKKTITGLENPIVKSPSRRGREMSCPYPTFWIDSEGSILQANRAFGRFVAVDVNKLITTSINQCRFAKRFPELSDWISEIFDKGRPIQQILVIPSIDDGSMSVLLSLAPIQGSRRKVGAVFGIIVPMNQD